MCQKKFRLFFVYNWSRKVLFLYIVSAKGRGASKFTERQLGLPTFGVPFKVIREIMVFGCGYFLGIQHREVAASGSREEEDQTRV